MTSVEIVNFKPASPRAVEVLDALASACPCPVRRGDHYVGDADVLALWGPGSPTRFAAMAKHRAQGKHYIALDLSYWQRDLKFRVSIDAAHPQAWVMRRHWPMDRFASNPVNVSEQWNPSGPVIVAGLGRKARAQYGEEAVLAWEAEMMRHAAARWPERRILYRRKQLDAPLPPGAVRTSDAAIEQVLAGASLVITWHSNVAVDAIRMGIPVVCRDGAAAAISPSTLPDEPAPVLPAVRADFLRNLAWFQWAPSESRQMWAFLREALA